MEIIEE